MDSLMMLLDVGAAWLVIVGAQRRRPWLFVAAGAVLGLAFNVKLFEALIVLPALAVLALLASRMLPAHRGRTLVGAGAAFVAVSLSWVTAASLGSAGSHPWPIGSTNGSVWNVVFGFNGIDRLRSHASPAALKLDPPGPLRLLSSGHLDYATLVGTTLIAAVVLGGLALVVGRRRGDRLPAATAAFLGVWLVSGVALVSMMQRFQPRYLEAITPALAGAVGVGVAYLLRRSPRTLAAGAAVTAVVGVALTSPPGWAVAAALCAAVAAAGMVVAARRPPAGALAACALIAALAVPAAGALRVAQTHTSDAGLPVKIQGLDRLSAFLIHHQGGARYEVASTSTFVAGPLIIRDARPVLMLTSYHGRPLLTTTQLARLVRTGQVRYVLMGGSAGVGVVRWARTHAHDVSAAAGVAKGKLYAFSGAPNALPTSGHHRTTVRRPKSVAMTATAGPTR
jgi:4-amino-4-deoxy-L-arabinose transferase-like glycosyltransferase